jgi:peptidoglycan/LPS O-acetylase OafA/YrhL
MSESSKYRPDIDGLRAVAVLAVVAFHAAPGRLPGGFIGVDVFFVISGFLISSILLNSLEKGSFSLLEFYQRRVRRIFPALFVVLLACAVAGWLFLLPSEYQQLGKHMAAGTAFVSNFALWNESGYFDISAMYKPLLHLWSLGIEEQFYIFWPLMLWYAYKKNWSLPLTIGALAIASFILNIYLTGTDKSSAFYLPFPRFWELLVGALLACTVSTRQTLVSPVFSNIQSIAGMLFLATGFLLIDEEGAFPGWWVLMPVMGSALMISAGPQAFFNRWILSNRMMVWVGLISYPLYLWHWPILSFLRIMEGQEILQLHRIIAVATSFVLAWLTYALIEKPVRNSVHKISTVFKLLGLMTVIGLFGLAAYTTGGFKNRSSAMPEVANAGDIGQAEFFAYIKNRFYPCTPKTIWDDVAPELGGVRCYQSKPSDVKTLAIIGDSHAEHLFIGVAESLPLDNVVFYPTGEMPFISNKQLEKTFNYVLNDPSINAVMLNAIWIRKIDHPEFSEWKKDLQATVDELTSAGKTVYLIDDVPEFSFQPSRCKFIGRLGIDNKCRDDDAKGYLSYRPVFDEIAKRNQKVRVVHTYESFCRAGHCEMAEDGILLFRDDHHLNINGSKKIGPIIAREVNELR